MLYNNNKQPLVSINIITYNSARFVLETLESAKSQTYKNIELIVSDDCSKDNTIEICKKWIEVNKGNFIRTKLIEFERNTGVAPNINRSINAAKGEWVKLIAGDDALLPNCIEDNISFVSLHPNCYFVQSETVFYKERFCPECLQNIPSPAFKAFKSSNITSGLQYRILIFQNQNPITLFMNRSIINNINDFDESIPYLEDYPMWFRITKAGYKVFYFDKETVMNRVRLNSESRPSLSLIFTERMHKSLKMVYKKYIYSELPLINKILIYSTFKYRDFIICFNLNKKKGAAYIIDNFLSNLAYKYNIITIKRILRKYSLNPSIEKGSITNA